MSPFEYLSVLVSIIVGLAITQLLPGAARLIQIRRRIRPHVKTLCWMVSPVPARPVDLVDGVLPQLEQDWNFFMFQV